MRPTGGVRRYAVELEKAIATFGESERIGEGLGLGVGRLAGRRVGGSLARLAVDARASSLARRADIAHSVYYDCSSLGKRMPLIATFHDCIHERFSVTGNFRSSVLARDKRRSVERARFVLSISESTARDAAEFYRLNGSRSVVIYPPVGDVFTSKRMARPKPKLPGPYFLFVGPRSGYKEWSTLVHACGLLANAGTEVALISVGGGPLAPSELSLLHETGLAGRHQWLAYVSDEALAEHYRSAVALVCPSKFEGFGYPVAEALCTGGVCIASDGGSLAEFGALGCLMFPAGEVEALRDVLATCLSKGTASDTAHQSAAIEAFGTKRFVNQLKALYSSAI